VPGPPTVKLTPLESNSYAKVRLNRLESHSYKKNPGGRAFLPKPRRRGRAAIRFGESQFEPGRRTLRFRFERGEHRDLPRIPQTSSIPFVSNALRRGKTLEQLDSKNPLGSSPYFDPPGNWFIFNRLQIARAGSFGLSSA
jgi:hypothetical protein